METEHASRLRDHWWPRPGWRPGRIMLTWHLTFENAPDLHDLVREYHGALGHLPGLSPVPPEWLHLTIQGVGYDDEVTPTDVDAVVQSVRQELQALPRFDLTFGRPIVFGEAIAIRPEPAEPLQRLLTAIRDGIAGALGADAVPTGPEQSKGFHPHVSIAYSHVEADAQPYCDAIASIDRPPVVVPIHGVTLIRQERQLDPHWLYRWTTEATAPLSA
jgi:2'-5' RNA ligase